MNSQELKPGMYYLVEYVRPSFLRFRIPEEMSCFLMHHMRSGKELRTVVQEEPSLLLNHIIPFTVSRRGQSTAWAPGRREWEMQMQTTDVEDKKFELWDYIKTHLCYVYAFMVLLCSGSWNGVNKENIHKTVTCQPSRIPHRNLTRHASSFNLCQDLSRTLGFWANSSQRTEMEGRAEEGGLVAEWHRSFQQDTKVYLCSCTFHLILRCKPFLS